MLWTDLEVGDTLMLNPEILKVSKRRGASQHFKFLSISYKNLIIRKIIPHDGVLEMYFKNGEDDYWIWNNGTFWIDEDILLFKIVALKDD